MTPGNDGMMELDEEDMIRASRVATIGYDILQDVPLGAAFVLTKVTRPGVVARRAQDRRDRI